MNGSSNPAKTEARRLVEASAWKTRLAEANLDATSEFETWLALDPANRQAWQRVQSAWSVFGEHATAPEVLELRRKALAQARDAGRERWHDGYFAGSRKRAAMAAGFLVLLVGALLFWNLSPDVYRTGVGERRLVTLADDSQVQLDALTELRVSYSKHARDLTLVKGQARFDVAHESIRPFTVFAAGQKVIATGTAFNVDLIDRNLLVTLIEGHVVVVPEKSEPPAATKGAGTKDPQGAGAAAVIEAAPAHIELMAGQQLTVSAVGSTSVQAANVPRAIAWQTGQLVFDNEPLSSVIVRINRYGMKTVTLGDDEVAALRISGVFKTGDVEGFVSTVTDYLPVNAMPADDAIQLSYRRVGPGMPAR